MTGSEQAVREALERLLLAAASQGDLEAVLDYADRLAWSTSRTGEEGGP